MREFVTPKQVARAIGVSESSLKRWCDKGLLQLVKTAGGHRRLEIGTVLDFIRNQNHHLVEPALLGLPATTGGGAATIASAVERFTQVLQDGDEELARQVLYDLYLAKYSIVDIGDRVIRPAFQKVGEAWECGRLEVYAERRACQVCVHALHDLRSQLPVPGPASPLAMGATLSGDNYQIPILLVEMTLRQAGWRAQSCGTNLTVETLLAALETHRPRVFWLSISHSDDEETVINACRQLNQQAEQLGIAFLLCGRWIQPNLYDRLQYTIHCHNLRDVENFARQIYMPEA